MRRLRRGGGIEGIGAAVEDAVQGEPDRRRRGEPIGEETLVADADAARFSFLLGAPIVAAAGAKGLLDTLTSGLDAGQIGVLAVGLATSALAGFAAIWGLLRYLQRASTAVFIVYRIVLGIGLIVLVVSR